MATNNRDREEVHRLIEMGQSKGFLTYDEIDDGLPVEMMGDDQLDDILSILDDEDVEIIDLATIDPHTLALLTGKEGVEIASRIAQGERAVLTAIVHSPVTTREITRLADDLRERKIRVTDIAREAEEDRSQLDEEESERRILSLLDKVKRLSIVAQDVTRPLATCAPARRAPIDAEIEENRQKRVETLEEMRLSKKAIDQVVLTLRLRIQKIECAQGSILELAHRAGVGVHQLGPDLDLGALRETDDAIRKGERLIEDAKAELAKGHLHLLARVARRYTTRTPHVLDLIEKGHIGLMKAVDTFDSRRGYRFSTYATWCIRQAMTSAIAHPAHTLPIPVHLIETIDTLIRTILSLIRHYGREPTPQEIAEKTELPLDQVRTLLKIAKGK